MGRWLGLRLSPCGRAVIPHGAVEVLFGEFARTVQTVPNGSFW